MADEALKEKPRSRSRKPKASKTMSNEPTYSCKLCKAEDNLQMVQCDSCDIWCHFKCVGVDETIQNHDWKCEDCTKSASKAESVHSQTKTVNSTTRSTRSRRINLQLQRLEEERALRIKRAAQELKEERALQEQRKAKQLQEDKQYMDERFKLLSQQTDSDDQETNLNEETVCDKDHAVDAWVQAQSTQLTCTNFHVQPPQTVKYQHPPPPQRPSASQPPLTNNEPIKPGFSAVLPPTSTRLPEMVKFESVPQLTRSHLAARQALPNDLPIFSGRPDEWPIFISCFQGTTEACGITNMENIHRLQKCLKGPALEAVRSRLLFPQNVPTIIETLRIIFGRPETIIQSLLQKVRAEPNPKSEKLETIIPFALAVDNMCSTMEVCGMTSHLNNPVLLQELIEKLPPQIKLSWATFSSNIEVNLNTLGTWLMKLAGTVSSVTYNVPQIQTKSTARGQGHVAIHSTNPSLRSSNQKTCCICSQSCAKVENCNIFNNFNTTERWNAVKRNKLCRLCLFSHIRSRCRLTEPCGINGCTYKHHRLLHNYNEDTIATSARVNTHVHSQKGALFRILPATVFGKRGPVKIFVFLDEGSSLSLMDASLADELELEGPTEALCLKWTGDTHRIENQSKIVSVQIASESSKKTYSVSDVRTVSALKLPTQSICMKTLESSYPYLKGLPISSYSSSTPRLLIGLNNWHLGTQLRYREGTENQPIASKTRLGWTINGLCEVQKTNNASFHVHHSFHHCECMQPSDDNLHDMMHKYFSLDSLGVTADSMKTPISPDDQRALQIMETETVRIDDYERYETALLWKYDQVELPDSLPMAIRRFRCLQARLDRDPELKDNLNRQISEYVRKGYIRKLSKEELDQHHPRIWYLPIFPVVNPKKPQKTRIVWDAAAKVKGISLNSVLLKGPDQLTSLLGVLHRFRERKVAICGDIREMYHQVRIKQEDQHAQRFLWQPEDSTIDPDVYVAQVMTFGATCSPSCAQFIKNKNASTFIDEYPRAVRCIQENHYVDDLLDSVDTEAEAIQLCKEVKRIHQHGGFEIGKWKSNSLLVVNVLGEACSEQSHNLNMNLEVETDKVLGMWWHTSTDQFTYVVTRNESNQLILQGFQKPSKREVLRVLMTIYDPLGLIAHFLVLLKILLQDIWKSSIGWDDQINDQQFEQWRQWIRMLDDIEKLTIPRCYLTKLNFDNEVKTELHIFVDASSYAYAACAYFRCIRGTYYECSLVSAKTRVAPIKLISIPRLELEAAKLGVRLANSIIKEHSVHIDKKVFWSDSNTVLSWIRADHRKYRQFVAFRVTEILESTKVEEWRYVPTKLNVADEGTKWPKKQLCFESNGRWYTGPPFLTLSEAEWPANIPSIPTTEEEMKPHHFTDQSGPSIIIDVARFSKWMRLLRSTVFAFRFIYNSRHEKKKLPKRSGEITREEYQEAEAYLFREAQLSVYINEFLTLAKQKPKLKHQRTVEKSSSIYKLSPYLDRNGVLRHYGRIDAALKVDRDVKRPIILPRGHAITRLLILHMHEKFHHLHSETVVNELRQKFWIPRIRVAVKEEVKRNCMRCKIRNATSNPPLMGKLPPARLATYHRPFSYSGIDYFGPMFVTVGRRTEKRWGVLITCMTTRAIHLEVASSLSSDSCILAIKRFIARRGTPIEFHSDNGTNFHGAKRELQDAFDRQSEIAKKFSTTMTKWVFNPPSAPHMGGTWERMVQTVKKVLKEIAPIHNPSDELLYSMLLEVEKTVNCHPLTYLPLDTEEDEALTPNHFLLGSSDGSKPDCIITEHRLLRKHWMRAQQFANTFWKRWLKEYLPTLTRRGKWWAPARPIEVGDVVLIIDENNPRNLWPKGRVIKCQNDRDEQVRKVIVQTRDGIYQRPAMKIAVLDVQGGKSFTSAVLPGGSVAANDI